MLIGVLIETYDVTHQKGKISINFIMYKSQDVVLNINHLRLCNTFIIFRYIYYLLSLKILLA